MRGPLTEDECNDVKQSVVDMLEECEIHTWPIDCFEIARKLHYVLRPYSSLPWEEMLAAYATDPDGFSIVELNPDTGFFQYVIYYDDVSENKGRIRWTIFHEIGHIYRGHHDNPEGCNKEKEEAEAELFAKCAIAPLVIIRHLRCTNAEEIKEAFDTSEEAAGYILSYYWKRVHYGSRYLEPFESQLIQLFGISRKCS